MSEETTELTMVPDKNQRLFDTRISPLYSPDKRLSGYLINLRDVTEKQKTEEDRARLAAVIEQAKDTFVITDINGNITYAIPHFEETTG